MPRYLNNRIEPYQWLRRYMKETIQSDRTGAWIQRNAGTPMVGTKVERLYLRICAAKSRLMRARERRAMSERPFGSSRG